MPEETLSLFDLPGKPVEYRDVPGFPGYRVGDDGSVWTQRISGRGSHNMGAWRPLKLKPIGRYNHLYVTLCGPSGHKNKFVHRLVLEAFIGPCPDGKEGCHFPNRDPSNNNIDNLRWDTRQSNRDAMLVHGTRANGVRHGSAKLTEADVTEMRRLYIGGAQQKQLAKRFSIDRAVVSVIVRGKAWKHVAQNLISEKRN